MLSILSFIQDVGQSVSLTMPSDPPWWVNAVVGPAGAIIILCYLAWSQNQTIKGKDQEILQLTRSAIECITKVVERHGVDDVWKVEVKEMIQQILSHASRTSK